MIRGRIEQARYFHKKIIEETYDGRCDIAEKRKTRRTNGSMGFEYITVRKNESCLLIHKSTDAAIVAQPASAVEQKIILLLAPDIIIKEGSKITVTQNGVTKEYFRSGKPAIYVSHQEVELELTGEYA